MEAISQAKRAACGSRSKTRYSWYQAPRLTAISRPIRAKVLQNRLSLRA